MSRKYKERVVYTVEQFAKMTSSDICKAISGNDNYWIVGDKPGVDRHIVERTYQNK